MCSDTTGSVIIEYVGGPTAVIDIGGKRFLTDPTFDPPGDYPIGQRVLSKTAGPARSPDALGAIDAVLLSHDQHPDNLDRSGRDVLAHAALVLSTRSARERLGDRVTALDSPAPRPSPPTFAPRARSRATSAGFPPRPDTEFRPRRSRARPRLPVRPVSARRPRRLKTRSDPPRNSSFGFRLSPPIIPSDRPPRASPPTRANSHRYVLRLPPPSSALPLVDPQPTVPQAATVVGPPIRTPERRRNHAQVHHNRIWRPSRL